MSPSHFGQILDTCNSQYFHLKVKLVILNFETELGILCAHASMISEQMSGDASRCSIKWDTIKSMVVLILVCGSMEK